MLQGYIKVNDKFEPIGGGSGGGAGQCNVYVTELPSAATAEEGVIYFIKEEGESLESLSREDLEDMLADYLLKDGDTATNVVAYEKAYSGTDTTIDMSKGLIQVLSASSITLPELPDDGAATLTIICTATTVTWNGTIKWADGNAPSFKTDKHNIVSFMGVNGSWYGSYIGNF